MIYKALCIKQPHIQRIICGKKLYEIRSWTTKYRGDLVLCSSKKWDTTKDFIVYNHYLLKGHALAIARIKEIYEFKPEHVDKAMTDWKPDHFAWEMEIVREITPIPVKGKLGIFNLDLPEL